MEVLPRLGHIDEQRVVLTAEPPTRHTSKEGSKCEKPGAVLQATQRAEAEDVGWRPMDRRWPFRSWEPLGSRWDQWGSPLLLELFPEATAVPSGLLPAPSTVRRSGRHALCSPTPPWGRGLGDQKAELASISNLGLLGHNMGARTLTCSKGRRTCEPCLLLIGSWAVLCLTSTTGLSTGSQILGICGSWGLEGFKGPSTTCLAHSSLRAGGGGGALGRDRPPLSSKLPKLPSAVGCSAPSPVTKVQSHGVSPSCPC